MQDNNNQDKIISNHSYFQRIFHLSQLSQSAFARSIGTSRANVHHWLTGKRKVSDGTVDMVRNWVEGWREEV